ncbi:MAG: A/G-specific adenine glycosylase [Acetobacteraceae bacterium]|nr:A/G-specific adenine glycosylase [Acetobacteraceae bacterium]MBV8523687.1 A/G-specific adenine glycosylase [Acetobacteraceae bacterium]
MINPPASALLAWYDRHRRNLPWRAQPGQAPDPYRVWLSEVMLQQTTVATVIPYYGRFLSRFPTIEALAAAPLEAVMRAWAGLGYYARARNLHACARAVVAAGGFPRELSDLRKLPGIGAYTAAAIGAIAFDLPVIPVDGNVERVLARLFAITAPLPANKSLIDGAAAMLAADPDARARPSDFAQALFDLGATVCTPKAPRCVLCPWIGGCAGRVAGIAEALPHKANRPERPRRYGVHFYLRDPAGAVLLRRRPPEGLLGGTLELPGTAWRANAWRADEALAHAPAQASWRRRGQVRHGFTHFVLLIDLFAAELPRVDAEGFLCPRPALAHEALPSVMRKCLKMAGAYEG